MALDCTFRIDTARSPCDTTTTPHLFPSPPFSPPVYHPTVNLSRTSLLLSSLQPFPSSPVFIFYLSLSKRKKERKEERKKKSRGLVNCDPAPKIAPFPSPPPPLSRPRWEFVPAFQRCRFARFGNASTSGEMLGMARPPRNGLSCCSRDWEGGGEGGGGKRYNLSRCRYSVSMINVYELKVFWIFVSTKTKLIIYLFFEELK